MRALLTALVLGLACTPLHAQTEKEPKKTEKKKAPAQGHTVGKDSQPPKGKPSAAEKQQRKLEEDRRRAQKDDERGRARKPQFDPARPQDQRARERVPGDPPPDHGKHTVSRDSQPPKGQPSPASQFQQKQADQFQQRPSQQGQPQQFQQRQTQQQNRGDEQRTVQCTASPVCGGGGYGTCQGVAQTYAAASTSASRRDIVRQCVQANTPDTCRCIPQCERVAQCSNF